MLAASQGRWSSSSPSCRFHQKQWKRRRRKQSLPPVLLQRPPPRLLAILSLCQLVRDQWYRWQSSAHIPRLRRTGEANASVIKPIVLSPLLCVHVWQVVQMCIWWRIESCIIFSKDDFFALLFLILTSGSGSYFIGSFCWFVAHNGSLRLLGVNLIQYKLLN